MDILSANYNIGEFQVFLPTRNAYDEYIKTG